MTHVSYSCWCHSPQAEYDVLVYGASTGSQALTAYHATATAGNVAAGRVSYTFNMKGPSLAIDTACSSSLVAVHAACQALQTRECSTALGQGCHALLNPLLIDVLMSASFLSNRCKTLDQVKHPWDYCFSYGVKTSSRCPLPLDEQSISGGRTQIRLQDADGYVRGESCVSMLIKPSNAPSSNKPLGLIMGSSVNQDGRSSALTAPNGPSQQSAVSQAWQRADLETNRLVSLQVHPFRGSCSNLPSQPPTVVANSPLIFFLINRRCMGLELLSGTPLRYAQEICMCCGP